MKRDDKSIDEAASALMGMRLDQKRAKETPFPTKQDLERKFRMDVDQKREVKVKEVD